MILVLGFLASRPGSLLTVLVFIITTSDDNRRQAGDKCPELLDTNETLHRYFAVFFILNRNIIFSKLMAYPSLVLAFFVSFWGFFLFFFVCFLFQFFIRSKVGHLSLGRTTTINNRQRRSATTIDDNEKQR